MKWKLLVGTVGLTTMLTLAACGNNDKYDEGRMDNNHPNVENTRYHNDGSINDDPTRNPNINHDGTMDDNQVRDRNMDRNNDRNNIRNNNRNNNRYDVAKEAANKITDQIGSINHAYVLTTNHNAYVAADLDANNHNRGNDNSRELTDDVKQKIAKIVKSTDNNIDNVYVSTDPDFLNLTNNYVNDTNNGKPVRGFFDQMGDMIKRVFPEHKE